MRIKVTSCGAHYFYCQSNFPTVKHKQITHRHMCYFYTNILKNVSLASQVNVLFWQLPGNHKSIYVSQQASGQTCPTVPAKAAALPRGRTLAPLALCDTVTECFGRRAEQPRICSIFKHSFHHQAPTTQTATRTLCSLKLLEEFRCDKCKNTCKHFHHMFSLKTFLCVFKRR